MLQILQHQMHFIQFQNSRTDTPAVTYTTAQLTRCMDARRSSMTSTVTSTSTRKKRWSMDLLTA